MVSTVFFCMLLSFLHSSFYMPFLNMHNIFIILHFYLHVLLKLFSFFLYLLTFLSIFEKLFHSLSDEFACKNSNLPNQLSFLTRNRA